MRRDGVALVLAVLVPCIAFAILTLTFSNAVIRNLRVAIVDADRSATSLLYVQSIASAPGVTVAERGRAHFEPVADLEPLDQILTEIEPQPDVVEVV